MPIFSPLPARNPQAPNPLMPRCPAPPPSPALPRDSTTTFLRLLPLLLALACTTPAASAQVLARPGMKLPGFSADNSGWWKRAVFYQIPAAPDAAVDYKALAARLDAMQSIGIDALIVPAPALPTQSAASAEDAIAAQSTLDSFDEFTRQATARGIHVVLALPASRADADLAGRARFWLTRGVSGFRLITPPETSLQQSAAIAQAVRALGSGAMGERVVLANLPDEVTSTAAAAARQLALRPAGSRREATGRSSAAAQLHIESLTAQLASPSAAVLRPLLAQALLDPGILLDAHPPAGSPSANAEQAKLLATVALTTSSAALVDPAEALVLPASAPPAPEPELESAKPAPPPTPAQPPPGVYLPYVPYVPPPHPRTAHPSVPAPQPPPDPLTAWYGKLAALHHSNAALRSGSKVLLDFDAQNALVWIARPASPTPQNPPVFVLCNLSSAPIQLSLADAVKKLGLHGFFLRTLLRSDSGLGAQDLNAVSLPPFGVFIGELHR